MRDKLIWKLLGAYVPLILLSVIVLNFFVSISLRNHFEEKIAQSLRSHSKLVGTILVEDIQKNDVLEIQKQVRKLGDQLDLRITVIDGNGKVLGDSQENPAKMENHRDRPEIVDALANGQGTSKRYSDTLNYNMKYVAVPLSVGDESVGVIRLAIALKDLDSQIRVIYRAVLFGGIIAAILMILVGYYISKSITNPISEMKIIAERISKGDFSQKLSIKSKDELGSLATSLNRMADDLQSQIENLKKMDRVRTDFVANVSHELKTPLTSIKGYVETLQNGALEDKENAPKFLKIINKHVDSLSNIVDDLLALSEVELGKDRLKVSTFDLKDLLEDVITGFDYAFKEKELKCELNVLDNDLKISADKGKLEQVFVNIIDNAMKYSEKGGAINVSLTREDDQLLVAIEDSGVGIPTEDVQRVFERFYRVNKARSREVGGTGLGLAIVKHIVSLHHGEVSISSAVNQGTKVLVNLPALNSATLSYA